MIPVCSKGITKDVYVAAIARILSSFRIKLKICVFLKMRGSPNSALGVAKCVFAAPGRLRGAVSVDCSRAAQSARSIASGWYRLEAPHDTVRDESPEQWQVEAQRLKSVHIIFCRVCEGKIGAAAPKGEAITIERRRLIGVPRKGQGITDANRNRTLKGKSSSASALTQKLIDVARTKRRPKRSQAAPRAGRAFFLRSIEME